MAATVFELYLRPLGYWRSPVGYKELGRYFTAGLGRAGMFRYLRCMWQPLSLSYTLDHSAIGEAL